MAFRDTIQYLPYLPTSQMGSGFLTPMLRASQHLLFLLACTADEKVEVTDDEAVYELEQASLHWEACAIPACVSTRTTDNINLLHQAIREARTEYNNWETEDKTRNLRDLVNRIAQNAASLDRELTGITTSDPGISL